MELFIGQDVDVSKRVKVAEMIKQLLGVGFVSGGSEALPDALIGEA